MIARGRLLKYFFINFFANLFVFRFFRFRLKLECEKLASEKTEMQRHYVMVSEPALVIRFVEYSRANGSHSSVWFQSRIQPQQCSGSHRATLCPLEMLNEITKRQRAVGMFQRFMEMSKYFHRNSPISAEHIAVCIMATSLLVAFSATSYHRVDCTWTHDGYLIIIFFPSRPGCAARIFIRRCCFMDSFMHEAFE